ncbi:hypothetical protein LR48_Vigan08g096600 [Vigna angularis]|uniref:Putative plant transposon protein domain-containing protein n=1 Tax=Phaseolus angularis TaxID=3914 RepID=A0A0L9V629_PHAAN|nr:hypothetical protein LR48_Vigan08g096600 [Vigna angularis]
MATKRKEKEPEQPQSSRFLSRKHEKHFRVVQDRRLLMERKVGMIPNFAPQYGEQVLGNDWGKLATYPTPANIAVVKEFYTNAKKIGDYPAENYLGYVRGHAIRYDPDSINNFLDTVWAGEQCQFALCMEEGADFEDVERVLCIPGGHFQRNRSGSVVNIRRIDLTPLAKYWMAFSHANIQPCSHVSDITLSRALFIYCAIRNLNVNIGQVIADEISVCANTSNNKAPLGHPSLITHLCKLAGVDTSVPPFERPRKAIDEAYYKQYCGGEDVAQPVPPPLLTRIFQHSSVPMFFSAPRTLLPPQDYFWLRCLFLEISEIGGDCVSIGGEISGVNTREEEEGALSTTVIGEF